MSHPILNAYYFEICKNFSLFMPISAGPPQDVVRLTIQAANQTFPFLVDLIRSLGGAPVDVIEISSPSESAKAATAQLKSLFDKYGSDKASPHNYHHVYGLVLANPDSVTHLLEVGIGSNNEDVVSNMGKQGKPGASLRAFSEFMPHANIYGADVDRRILFEENNIKTFFVDQTDPKSFEAISAAVNHDFDLIIDDGLHSPNANIATLTFALKHLKPGGWFVVEDISAPALPVWQVISVLLPPKYNSRLISTQSGFLFLVQRTQ